MAKKKKLPKAQEGNFSKFMTWATGSPHIMGPRIGESGHPDYENYTAEERDDVEIEKMAKKYNTPIKTIKSSDYIGNPVGYFNAKAKERKDSAHKSKYRNINGEL